MNAITIQTVKNGYLVAPWGHCQGSEDTDRTPWVFANLDDLLKALPMILTTKVTQEPLVEARR